MFIETESLRSLKHLGQKEEAKRGIFQTLLQLQYRKREVVT